MGLFTPMTLDEARAIGAAFGLEPTGLTPIAHGSVNSNFAVDLAGGGRAFLRVCEESPRAAVEQQNRLLAHLVACGVPTPAPLSLVAGGTVAEHRGKPVAAFAFCSGSWICQARVTPAHLQAVGRALARVHLAGAAYHDAPPTRFGPADLHGRIQALRDGAHGPLSSDVAAAVDLLAARLAETEQATATDPPSTVIHGDVFRDNVLWHEGSEQPSLSAILDFESASRGHPAFDLMVTMLAWCFGDRLEQPLARALLAGYLAERSLPPDELAACYQQARAAAVRFAITRITDYELRPRGTVVYKDFRRFLARLAALEAIGPASFPDWLT